MILHQIFMVKYLSKQHQYFNKECIDLFKKYANDTRRIIAFN